MNKHPNDSRPTSENEFPLFATGVGVGGPATITLYTAAGMVADTLTRFGDGSGGARAVTADATGDGVADVIAATRPGIALAPDTRGGPRVVVYDGRTGAKLADFFGIDDANFRGDARLSMGGVNADGLADLVVAAGIGGPQVAVYDGASVRPGRCRRTWSPTSTPSIPACGTGRS